MGAMWSECTAISSLPGGRPISGRALGLLRVCRGISQQEVQALQRSASDTHHTWRMAPLWWPRDVSGRAIRAAHDLAARCSVA